MKRKIERVRESGIWQGIRGVTERDRAGDRRWDGKRYSTGDRGVITTPLLPSRFSGNAANHSRDRPPAGLALHQSSMSLSIDTSKPPPTPHLFIR